MFEADEIVEHSDKQLLRAIPKSCHCLKQLLPPRKYFVEIFGKKDMDWNYRYTKPKTFKSSFVKRCLYLYAMLFYCTIVLYPIHVLYYG